MSRKRTLTDEERVKHRREQNRRWQRKWFATMLPERSKVRPYVRGISFDRSRKSVRNKRHECYRAEIWTGGKRIRKRFKNYDDAVLWLQAMRQS